MLETLLSATISAYKEGSLLNKLNSLKQQDFEAWKDYTGEIDRTIEKLNIIKNYSPQKGRKGKRKMQSKQVFM